MSLRHGNSSSNERRANKPVETSSMLIIRVVLGVVLVLALVPVGNDSAPDSSSGGFPGVGAFVAASAAIEDLGGFCDRQPAACAVGAEAVKSLADRARQGARALQDYVIDVPAREETGTLAAPATPPSQDTLTAADRLPAWRGPSA
jgi:hypothetical protein